MCFVVLLGAILPRLTLVLVWLFTTWTQVLQPWWLGFLGFLFVPCTTLAYVLIHLESGQVTLQSFAHVAILVVALLLDSGAWGGGRRHYYRTRRVDA
jgi:hypothetical protein